MNENNLNSTQRLVFASLSAYDRTAAQVAIDTGLSGNTVRPRLLELETLGLARRSGERRRTLSGRTAEVWTASPQKRCTVCGNVIGYGEDECSVSLPPR